MYRRLVQRWSVPLLAGVCTLAAAPELRAQACPPDAELVVIFSPGDPVPASGSIDRIQFEAKSASAPIGTVAGHALPWTPTAQEITELQRISGRAVAVYRSSHDLKIICPREFQVVASPPSSGADGNAAKGPSGGGDAAAASGEGASASPNPRVRIPLETGDCQAAGDSLLAHIAQERPGSDFTAVIFDGASQAVCFQHPDRPKVGGWLNVAVLTNNEIDWTASRISYSPCSLQKSTLSLFAPDKLPTISGTQDKEFVLLRFQPRRCYDEAVNITVESNPPKNAPDTKVTMRHELAQAPRYHAALQVGVVFSNLHDHEFGLTRDRDTTRVFDKGPVRNGPEYTATIVIYSLLRQLGGLTGGERFPGREPVSENSALDRIGGVLGVGLSKPGERFVAGLSYEAVPGVNAALMWDFARVRRLVGIQPGAAFSGSEQQLPVQRKWRTDLAFGLSLDLTYAAKLLGR